MTQHLLFNIMRELRVNCINDNPQLTIPLTQTAWSGFLHLTMSQNVDGFQGVPPEVLAFPNNVNHNYRANNQMANRLECTIDLIECDEHQVWIAASHNAGQVRFSIDFSHQARDRYQTIAMNTPQPSVAEIESVDFVFDAFWQVLRELAENWVPDRQQPVDDEDWNALNDVHKGKYEALLRLTLGHPDLDFIGVGYQIVHNQRTPEFEDAVNRLYLTTIGACIFYLPQAGDRYFIGRISLRALQNMVEDIDYRAVRDHVFPRKLGARELVYFILERVMSIVGEEHRRNYIENQAVKDIYRFCVGQLFSFALVTTAENMALRNWYLVHPNYENANDALNIEFFDGVPERAIERVAELEAFASYLRVNTPLEWSLDAVRQSFSGFIQQV